jgi:hypothetical protein
MVKILLLTAMHQRPQISELFCISAMRLLETWKYVYDITVCSLVSDPESEEVCRRYGIEIIPTPASPLGMKMNVGMTIIMANYKFDYLLQIDDDDIFSPDILEWYTPYIKKRIPYFGVDKVYFYDLLTNRAILFKYHYETGKLLGCGRMFLREALERTAYRCSVVCLKNRTYLGIELQKNKTLVIPEYQAKYAEDQGFVHITSGPEFQLYKNDQIKGMNTQSEFNLVFNGYLPKVVDTPRPLFTDVKSTVNIWQFDDYKAFGSQVDPAEAMHFWSDAEKEYLQSLREKL